MFDLNWSAFILVPDLLGDAVAQRFNVSDIIVAKQFCALCLSNKTTVIYTNDM